MSAQPFLSSVSEIQNAAKGTNGKIATSQKVNQASTQGDFDFKVQTNSSFGNLKENFQDIAFGGRSAQRKNLTLGSFMSAMPKSRRSTVLAALPEGAEGSWGDVDRKYVIGGNWKSNGDWEFVNSFPDQVLSEAKFSEDKVEVVVAPTYIHMNAVKEKLANNSSKVQVSAQDCSEFERGAFTGNITADQIKDMGVNWTLTGHSERRTLFGETDEVVALKTKIALDNGLNVMLCIGEQLEERENGTTDVVNARQLQAVAEKLTEGEWANVVIAYEPVWAIGTGKTATPQIAQETHAEIREWLGKNVSKEAQ
mmetsp:Transcript_2322/g.3964  ORF Transcript_2322/g.3964 Transcript_2322/m.3964 type:complete len:310 (-) Transcript_2322:224-1153(-)